MTPREALAKAIELAGGPSKVAASMGIKPQAVSQWEQCPDRRVLALEQLTGGQVTRSQLRPDLYPTEQAA